MLINPITETLTNYASANFMWGTLDVKCFPPKCVKQCHHMSFWPIQIGRRRLAYLFGNSIWETQWWRVVNVFLQYCTYVTTFRGLGREFTDNKINFQVCVLWLPCNGDREWKLMIYIASISTSQHILIFIFV